MTDVHNILFQANGGELLKTASDMGKPVSLEPPIAPEVANSGDVK